MTPRRQIAQRFRTELGSGWNMQGYPAEPNTVTKPTLIVYQESVSKARLAAGAYLATVVLFVVVPQQKPGVAEDALDIALEKVLAVLEAFDALTWDTVERQTLAEKYHGYRITTTAAYGQNQE